MMIPKNSLGMGLFDDMFDDSFFTKKEKSIMKTDIKEKDGKYILDMDLPGYEKENISIEIDKGYLTVTASHSENVDEEDKHGNYIHQERYVGKCSRSFYVGEHITEEDVKASFKNGTLSLEFPKEEQKQLQEKKYIPIE